MSVYRDAFEQCPRCGVELVDARSARGCRQCNGMWLPQDVLTEMVLGMLPPVMGSTQLVFTPRVADAPDVDAAPLGCPACHAAMERVAMHGISVDRCTEHGIWFDSDELETVLRRTADPDRPPALGVQPTYTTVAPVAPSAPVVVFRILRAGKTELREVRVQLHVIKLGRLASSHVRLDDDSGASRMHAVIEASAPDDLAIIDLGSEAGTLVNGHRINKTRLATGDVIVIGDTAIEVEILART